MRRWRSRALAAAGHSYLSTWYPFVASTSPYSTPPVASSSSPASLASAPRTTCADDGWRIQNRKRMRADPVVHHLHAALRARMLPRRFHRR